LSNIVATVPASISFPNKDSLSQSLGAQYEASLAAIPDSPFKTQGIAAGSAAAHALDNADSARLLAMMNLSGADAAINCWNDKYHFDFWRPWQAIRQADLDGNPATAPDTTWRPLLTAPYPEHSSGHMCLD